MRMRYVMDRAQISHRAESLTFSTSRAGIAPRIHGPALATSLCRRQQTPALYLCPSPAPIIPLSLYTKATQHTWSTEPRPHHKLQPAIQSPVSVDASRRRPYIEVKLSLDPILLPYMIDSILCSNPLDTNGYRKNKKETKKKKQKKKQKERSIGPNRPRGYTQLRNPPTRHLR